jgi:hypothetical protein
MEEKKMTYRVFVGRPKGKRHLARPRCRWEGNVKINIIGKI